MAGWPQEKPTPFVMDEWKRTYSNCGGDYKKAMEVSDLPAAHGDAVGFLETPLTSFLCS
jgi:hypothetical protein